MLNRGRNVNSSFSVERASMENKSGISTRPLLRLALIFPNDLQHDPKTPSQEWAGEIPPAMGGGNAEQRKGGSGDGRGAVGALLGEQSRAEQSSSTLINSLA